MDLIEDEFIIFIKGNKCPLCRQYIMYVRECNFNE